MSVKEAGMKLTVCYICTFVSFVSACGGSGSSVTTPVSPTLSPPTATAPATDLRIAGPDLVLTGYSAKYDATATLSNGVMIYHTNEAWNTDNTDVATINSNGVLTGHAPGVGTITATYRGAVATASVRIMAPSRPFPARMVISFRPDPVPGSLTPCTGAFWRGQTPTWSSDEVFNETHGVGFTLEVETLNFYNQDGLRIGGNNFREDYYFPPNSEFIEDGCMALGGSPNGFFDTVLDGVDDNGNHLTFASRRLRLLPVAGVSPASRPFSLAPMGPGAMVRALRRVR
jgi:Bacterial Ig-like domain (group 2)